MNHCIFVGNLVSDPELSTIDGARGPVSVVKFKIGVNTRLGPDKTESAFPFCEAWDKGAEVIAKHFRKGDLIRVFCRMVTQTWQDKATGENRYRDMYRVERFEFPELNSPKGAKTGSEQDQPPAPSAEAAPPAKAAAKGKGKVAPKRETVPPDDGDDEDDDETPF